MTKPKPLKYGVTRSASEYGFPRWAISTVRGGFFRKIAETKTRAMAYRICKLMNAASRHGG
jgi:hypothetical protein